MKDTTPVANLRTAMHLIHWLAIALVCMAPVAIFGEEPAPPLVLERTIALRGVTGRIDHMAFDPSRKRLFVAELGNGTLDVIDLTTGAVTRRIEGLQEPQDVGYAVAADVLAVASSGDGSVRLFRGGDLSPLGSINLGADADNVRLDVRTGDFIVGYGSGGLALINPVRASLILRIPLPAHPEGFQLDPDSTLRLSTFPTNVRSRSSIWMPDGKRQAG